MVFLEPITLIVELSSAITYSSARIGRQTSYRALRTVMGLRTKPTEVRAIAPAMTLPVLDRRTRAVLDCREPGDVGERGRGRAK